MRTAAPGCPAGQSPTARSTLLSHTTNLVALIGLILCTTTSLAGFDFIPIHEAAQHIGETKSVAGKVLRVNVGVKGVHFSIFAKTISPALFSWSSSLTT